MSKDKGNPANIGNPVKRTKMEAKAQKRTLKKANRRTVSSRDRFMQVTGLTLVLVMSATLLVGVFTQF